MSFLDKKFLGGLAVGFIVFPILLVLGALVVTRVLFADRGKLPAPEMPYEQSVALDWNLTGLDGAVVNLQELASRRPVFINFWATWCPSCVKEMPNIEKLHSMFKNQVVFVCVSNEDVATLKDFALKKNIRMPLYKLYGERPPGLESRAVPATFILSPEGRIKVKHIGAADWADEKVVAYLTTLVGSGGK
ncbi:MAG: TlpA family protein disulfide reductase [Nitrospirae bacterium]|nr:TlpA family protein disulfide reductase [Nitrospirota bacterium]